MSRSAAGVYTLPAGNPVVTLTVIATSWANPTFTDIATEITNSLDRGGRGAMTAALKLFDGTVSIPGLSFSSEPSLGLYRESAGLMHFVSGSTKILSMVAAGITVLGTLTVNGVLTSAVVTGTAPFVVASTTKVNNLYVARAALADVSTTNANLTGPITSVGNATAIASQTGTGTTFAMSASPTFTGTVGAAAITPTGNVTFATVGQRILMDTTGAVRANRPSFQSAVVDQGLNVGFIPNGTATVTAITLYGGSDPDNTHAIQLLTGAASTSINSTKFGIGTQRALEMQIGGVTKATLDTAGNFGVNVTPTEKLHVDGRIRSSGTLAALQILNRAGTAVTYTLFDPDGNGLQLNLDTIGTILTLATVTGNLTSTGLIADSKGDVRDVPQNSKSAAYTTVAADKGKHIFHPSADVTARTWTIDSNANVPYAIGTCITFVNQNGAGVITISITTDTLRLAGSGATGNRTLAANGMATALKIAATEWIISGTSLS